MTDLGPADRRSHPARPTDTLRLTVIWHPSLHSGPVLAEAIADTFDRVGVLRDEMRLTVPVRIRTSRASAPHEAPRDIDWSRAETNGVIIFSNAGLSRAARRGWKAYVRSIKEHVEASRGGSFVIVVAADTAGKGFDFDLDSHVDTTFVGRLDPPTGSALRRVQIRLLATIGQHFKAACPSTGASPHPPAAETVFISHASVDGREIAEWIDGYVRSADLGVSTFLDSRSIPAGMNFRKACEHSIAHSAFLAIQTDAWGSRPYCQWELMYAKKHRRPILAITRLRVGEERAFPYAGNVTTRCIKTERDGSGRRLWTALWRGESDRPPLEADETEILIKDICSEVLRCLVWERTAQRVLAGIGSSGAIILPRPPELADIALLRADRDPSQRLLIYPDPPIGHVERKLLDALRGDVEIRSLSEHSELMAA